MLVIYGINIRGTDKVYVGKSIRLTERWATHRSKLNRGIHDCRELQAAYDKGTSLDFFKIQDDAAKEDELKWVQYFGSNALNAQLTRSQNKANCIKSNYFIVMLDEHGKLFWEGLGCYEAAKRLKTKKENILRYIKSNDGRGWNIAHRVWVTRLSSINDFTTWSAPTDTRKRY